MSNPLQNAMSNMAGPWSTTTSPSLGPIGPYSYFCVCGEPASNVCDNTLLCRDCFFKFSVAKSSCKEEEFWAEVHRKQKENAVKLYKQQLEMETQAQRAFAQMRQGGQQGLGQFAASQPEQK